MNSANVTFSKLSNEDKSRIFRLKVDWEEDSFRIFILEGKTAWFSLVTTDHLRKFAKQHELNFLTYMESLREYLCNSSSSITVGITPEVAEFIIYRHIEKENFKVKYLVIKLEQLDYQTCAEELIDTLTSKYKDMSNMVLSQDKQKLQLEEQKTMLEHKCEELAEMKNKSDLQIYSAVSLMLNEKNTRIQFLTELLEEHKNGNTLSIKSNQYQKQPSAHNKLNVSNDAEVLRAIPSTSKREVMSDSESNPSDTYNTDDEKNVETEKGGGDNLDFLGDESSPPPVVPKRFKLDYSACLPNLSTVDNQASTSLSIMSATKTEPTNSDITEDKSQASHYDTQDLLDMM